MRGFTVSTYPTGKLSGLPHSRPQVSNDNPYSESQFKTLKYHPTFPGRFASFEEAREFLRTFFQWYNQDHHHEGLMMLNPAVVHSGQADKTLQERGPPWISVTFQKIGFKDLDTFRVAYSSNPMLK